MDGDQCKLIKYGNLKLEVKFRGGLKEPIHYVLVYGELDSIIENK